MHLSILGEQYAAVLPDATATSEVSVVLIKRLVSLYPGWTEIYGSIWGHRNQGTKQQINKI